MYVFFAFRARHHTFDPSTSPPLACMCRLIADTAMRIESTSLKIAGKEVR